MEFAIPLFENSERSSKRYLELLDFSAAMPITIRRPICKMTVSFRDNSRSSRVVSGLLLFRFIFDAVQLMSPEIFAAAVSINGTKTRVAGRVFL